MIRHLLTDGELLDLYGVELLYIAPMDATDDDREHAETLTTETQEA